MQELLLRKKREKEETDPADCCRLELLKVQQELEQAERIFNHVTEDELLEASIYRIRALKAYREYLVRTAREMAGGAEQAVPL